MGNNPSKGPIGEIPSASSPSTPPASAEKKVTRQPSLNASSGTFKATAVDPSASKENATGHSTSQTQAPAQQRLQSRNPPDSTPRNVPDSKKPQSRSKDIASPDPSNPVQVPVSRAAARRDPYPPVGPSAPPHNTYYSASTHLQRPPRMPLPIGDATTTPGSPIIGPDDSYMGSPPSDPLLEQGAGPRESNLSSTIADDDEMLDDLGPNASTGVGRAVPTIIEWTAPGDKVYVTGTFVNWEKKFRLHRGENPSGVLSAKLNLRPGTHHLKFIVDGEMRASDNLPTAVDFTNHLVNYVEVSADDMNRARSHSDKQSRNAATPGIHPPQAPSDPVGASQDESAVADQAEKEEPEEIPMGDFRGILPQFLVDLDREDETQETPAYQQAVNIIGEAPTPPSLPLFLGKSILNGTTPMKDDSSVLNYPNHTVLNHLATSSIKNDVLATSVTTRYKRKYVTTILYKPTGDITG
ncbi:putative Snf1 kinase complex beta-subunit Gal83 [Aspergillus steynii IBT 23096]|uniref:Putative Snf1 kinase complex beta-subunit Gal83 n=1 Tax=Aspergillus steynii IBT 23096 TaxID=1392250 RepID=A0A2I2G9A8_9EURO|nr:putative Snf1 kinase complex beta-subunit Gal83 [Aspergillus steynii IBT 23096]PLB49461.1 putative Snf1 kinase complex beta-subunit Gal83 [Aspergillus steynii IBT 23096]